MESAIKELARFLGVTFDEAMRRVKSYKLQDMATEWDLVGHSTPEEVKAFYQRTDKYLYELIIWNNSPEYHTRIAPLMHYHNKKILELGAGNGTLCIALALNGNDVTYYDINPKLVAFAKQRFDDRLLPIKQVKGLTGLRDFDIVIGIDFFEHIHKDELPKLLKDIAGCLKDEGFLYERSNFGQQDKYPMHYDYSHDFPKWCEDAGLHVRENGDYAKSAKTQGVQIAIPIRGNEVKVSLLRNMTDMEAPMGTLFTTCCGYPVDLARNKLVRQLKKDWIFFMDSDQTFAPETLKRLMSWNLPIVSGLIFKRTAEPVPMIYRYVWEDGKGHYYKPLTLEVGEYLEKHKDILDGKSPAIVGPPYGLLECDGISMGCVLIHRRVFDAIGDPWFKCDENAVAGEDFYFCRKAQEAGFKIMADPSVICGHYSEFVRSYKHFTQWAMKEPFDWMEVD